MCKRIISILLVLILLTSCGASMNKDTITISNTPLFNPDYSELVGRSDLSYKRI